MIPQQALQADQAGMFVLVVDAEDKVQVRRVTIGAKLEAEVVVATGLAVGDRVIVAGLDMDFTGKPFGPVPQLLAIADYITKLHAICVHCGNIANISYRKTKQSGQVVIGEMDIYEPRCRVCYAKGDNI